MDIMYFEASLQESAYKRVTVVDIHVATRIYRAKLSKVKGKVNI